MLYRAARSGTTRKERDANERRVVLFATDGIVVRGGPLPLPPSKKLGEWELTHYPNGAIFVQPGVYAWLDENGRPIPEETRARGYLDRVFPWMEVCARWASGSAKPVKAWQRARFVGLGYCVSTNRWDLFLKFVQTKKNVDVRAGNAGETKRVDLTPSGQWTRQDNPAVRPMRTAPWDPCRAEGGGFLDSAPYKPKRDRLTEDEVEEELAELSARDAKHGGTGARTTPRRRKRTPPDSSPLTRPLPFARVITPARSRVSSRPQGRRGRASHGRHPWT